MKSSSINHHSNSTNDDKTFRLLRLSNCWGGNGNHFQTCTHSSKSQFPHFQRDDLCLGWCNHFALIILGQGSGCCSSRRKSKSQCTCVCSEVIYLQFLSLLFGWSWCFMHVWCNLFVAIHFHFPLEMDRNPFGEHAFPFFFLHQLLVQVIPNCFRLIVNIEKTKPSSYHSIWRFL